MEFQLGLLRRLAADPALEVKDAVQAAYKDSLAPFHGFFSSNLFAVRRPAGCWAPVFWRLVCSGVGCLALVV